MRGRLYIQLDVDYPDNPRIIAAGEDAEILYIRALCLAKRTLSDGFIDNRQLPRFGFPDVDERADALVREGLWERFPGGYMIAGWLERNRAADDIREQSTRRAESGRLGGIRSGEARRKQGVEAKAKQGASGLLEHRDRDRDRDKDKKDPGQNATHPAGEKFWSDFEKTWEFYPRKLKKLVARDAYVALRKTGADPVEIWDAVVAYAKIRDGKAADKTMYGATFFRKECWRDYLPNGPGQMELVDPDEDRIDFIDPFGNPVWK